MFLIILLQETGQNILNINQGSSWDIIIVGILTLLGVIIGVITTWFLHYKSFKDEYYKKLIDKRIESYELIDNILIHFRTSYTHDEVKGTSYHSCFVGVDTFKKLIEDFQVLARKSLWIGNDVANLLNNLYGFLREKINYQTDLEIRNSAAKHFNEIEEYFQKLRVLLYDDFAKLYNVKKFIKNKKIYNQVN